MRIRVGLLFSLAPTVISWSQDPVKLASQSYKVILDNEDARVIDYHLKPGENEPMHSHPSGVLMYYFTNAKMRVTHRNLRREEH